MKKACWLILGCLILTASIVSAQYIGSQKRKVVIEQTSGWRGCDGFGGALKIATFSTNPPFGWTEMAGNRLISKGFDVDLMQQIANEKKIALQPVGYQSDEEMRKAFEEGKIDIWVGSYYDPKIRGIGHTYLIPAFIPNVITVVFLKNKARDVKKFEDLKGLKGVVRQDEQFYPYIRLSLPKDLEIEEAFDSKEAFTKLITGKVDYLLSSPYSTEAEARRFKLNRYIKMVATPLMGQELFIVYSKNSMCPQFKKDFKEGLEEKRKDLNAQKRELINFIDTWGQRFKNEPSLIDQLKAEGTLPKDFVLDMTPQPAEEAIPSNAEAGAETADTTNENSNF